MSPTSKGIAFAVLEGGKRLIDWGTREAAVEYRNENSIRHVASLVSEYAPAFVIVEDYTSTESQRKMRVQQLLWNLEMTRFAATTIRRVAPGDLRKAVLGRRTGTKHELAVALAARFPELKVRLPRKRRAYDGSFERLAVFDAVALALASVEQR